MSKRILIIAESKNPKSGWGRYADRTISELTNIGYQLDSYIFEEKKNHSLKTLLEIRRMAKQADIIHAFDVWPYAIYGYLAVLGTKKKLFVSGIGTYSVPPSKTSLKRWLMVRALKRAQAVFCISQYVMKRMKEEVGANYLVVHMGTTELTSSSSSTSLSGRPKILTVGEVKERKGQLDTVKAINLLKIKYPDVVYYIVGSTKDLFYVQAIQEYIKQNNLEGNIKLMGRVETESELVNFYQNIDIFALNSNNVGDHFEGFGLVLLEAMQFGKPGIGSRDCGIEDVIVDGYNGFLTNQRDPQNIANKIDALLSMDSRVLAKNCSEFASRFSWAKMAQALEKEYEN